MVIYVGNVIAFSGILDVAFLFDNSGSMSARNAVALASAVLDKLTEESSIEAAATYTYQEEEEAVGEPNAVVIRGRSQDFDDIKTSFSEIEFVTVTEYVWSAILYVSEFHPWGGGRRVILCLADEGGDDPDNKQIAISSCNDNNVDVFAAVLFASGSGFDDLVDTCSQTGGDSLFYTDYDNTETFANQVFNMFFPD